MLHRRWADRGAADRGAAAVEAAIVTPLILLILFGIIEFGFYFKDRLAVVSSVRSGARTASAEPRNASYAQDAADAVAVNATALNPADIVSLWVYKADTDGYPLGGGSSFASCSTCVKFRWDPGSSKFVKSGDTWPAMSQKACPGLVRDNVGIYLKVKHHPVTGILGELDLAEHTVMSLEPIPVTSGCQ